MAAAEEIFPFIYALPLGYVNAFLLAEEDGLTLIDSGLKGNYKRILAGIREIGRAPEELRNVLVTHHHADHVGSLAALVQKSGAQTWVHPLDAPIVAGEKRRPHANPGSITGRVLGPLIERLPMNNPPPVKADRLVEDGDVVPAGGGVKVIATPGHTLGHVSYFVEGHGGVLFAGDAAGHLFGRIGKPALIFTEDMALARESMRKLAAMEFETACFGHGTVLKGRANVEFRRYVERMSK
ncbi:MAG TPA: MBL fold metallo-hydrolase [Dehalococcoidia bacterium]|jgi:glyoxylase-like metal-dependent hydrolase (beta-lactamase superfamily II)|nr:MBL fold metallo-hydrolase [Dehalococcoidia bacterium]